MRRTQSLSFLPGAGASNEGARRRLPDPGQGQLIQHIAAKLKEESLVRLQVAKELKAEKRLRWKTEDEAAALKAENKTLATQLTQQTQQIAALERDLKEALRTHETLEEALARERKKNATLTAEQQRVAAQEGQQLEQEAALDATLDELECERRENARMRRDFDALLAAMDEFQQGASKALLARVAVQSDALKSQTFAPPVASDFAMADI